MIDSTDPKIAEQLQNLSPHSIEQVIRDTADQIFQQADLLAIASQSLEATTELIQEILKGVLEGISEAAANL